MCLVFITLFILLVDISTYRSVHHAINIPCWWFQVFIFMSFLLTTESWPQFVCFTSFYARFHVSFPKPTNKNWHTESSKSFNMQIGVWHGNKLFFHRVKCVLMWFVSFWNARNDVHSKKTANCIIRWLSAHKWVDFSLKRNISSSNHWVKIMCSNWLNANYRISSVKFSTREKITWTFSGSFIK